MHIRRQLCITLLTATGLTALIGCTSEVPIADIAAPGDWLADEKIDCDGTPTWYDVEDGTATEQAWASSVGGLVPTSAGSSGTPLCSAFLVGPNLVMTAGHCIDTQAANTCDKVSVIFNHQEAGGSLPPTSEMPTYDCVEIIDQTLGTGVDNADDYALFMVSGEPGETFGYLEVDFRPPVLNEAITIIGHPNLLPQVISAGEVVAVYDHRTYYDADTAGGSSGSPVLDANGQVIAVHTNGDCTGGGGANFNHGMTVTTIHDDYSPFLREHDFFDQHALDPLGEDDRFGGAVAIGDFNGDGVDDIAVGAPSETVNGHAGAGSVSVRPGYVDGYGADPSDAVYFTQSAGSFPEAEDYFGQTLAAGDFDGDGYDELVVGAPFENWGATVDAGMIHVYPGSSSGPDITNGASFLAYELDGGTLTTNGHFGAALAVGDFDDDGYDDLAIGDPGDNNARGITHILLGSALGLASDTRVLQQSSTGTSPEADDRFGEALAVGDFDNNGIDDLAVGAPQEDNGATANTGHVSVFYSDGVVFTASGHFQTGGSAPEAHDYYGLSLAAGDFDGDGYDDLAVGVPAENNGSLVDSGMVELLYGSATTVGSAEAIWPYQLTSYESDEAGDMFGYALAAGNLSGDAYDDLVIGAPFEDFGRIADAGWAYVLWGSSTGPFLMNTLSASDVGSEDPNEHFGAALAIGELDGDWDEDLVVGIPGQSTATADAVGAVTVFDAD